MSGRLPSHVLQVGSVVADRYKITHLLGQGGMGAVYQADDLFLSEQIALKVLPFDAETHASLALRFRQEVRLSRRVSHPNVIRVHDIGEHEGILYFTMEVIPGTTLRTLMRKKALARQDAINIVHAIANALVAAHEANIIHRDLKPTNILVDQAGRVVLTDFGIARCIEEDLQLTHGAIGTAHYMAPEQAAGRNVDARADLFALGVVFYEMLVGELPHGPTTELALHLERLPEPIPPALTQLILSCLSWEPTGRPTSAFQFLEKLAASFETSMVERTAEALPVTGTQAPPVQNATPAPERIAVLPLRFRGPKDQVDLADVLTDELVDALSCTRGIHVLGTGATEVYRENRNPLQMGKDLGVHYVLDGSVQAIAERVRVALRLIDAKSAVQRWAQQVEGSMSDVFAFQATVVRQVAEELRVELATLVYGDSLPSRAIDGYVEARRHMRMQTTPSDRKAHELLSRVLEIAPGFAPAIAARAMTSVREWFLYSGTPDPSIEEEAQRSVAHALAQAPDIAESHLSQAMLETQRGHYQAAMSALFRTLDIAPTCAPAHEYLAQLLFEAGKGEAAIRHAKLAREYAPQRFLSLVYWARHYVYHGDFEGYSALMAAVEKLDRRDALLPLMMHVRVATYRGDRHVLTDYLERVRALGPAIAVRMTEGFIQAVLGEVEISKIREEFDHLMQQISNPRMVTVTRQIAAEMYAACGAFDLALEEIRLAAQLVLVDREWLDRCPLLVSIRVHPTFIDARRLVITRAAEIEPP